MVALFGRKRMSRSRQGEPESEARERPTAPPRAEPDARWQAAIADLSHAFQPVVNIHSGHTYGLEALLRGFERAGFASAEKLFDAAEADGALEAVDAALREKAIAAYAAWPFARDRKLFVNIDARPFRNPDYDGLADTRRRLAAHGLDDGALILDISERAPFGDFLHAILREKRTHRSALRYAVDDFGAGLASLRTLTGAHPDFIKIDRTLLAGAGEDSRKKIFFSHIVSIAHLLGILVVAEEVENESEYFVCKEVGCDLIQGFVVCPPLDRVAEAERAYLPVRDLSRRDRRQSRNDERILLERMEALEPLPLDTRMLEVFERFRAEKARTFFPVVDASGEPRGIIREGDLKEYTYSQFGRDLMTNRAYGRSLEQFLSPCPVAAINLAAERILEIFSGADHAEGLILVDGQSKYAGFLSATALLRVINDKNLTLARDQNPLSRLPGNTVIHEYLSECLADASVEHAMVYYDFDNFKPFNDHYGFRQGDRAIQAFADLLRRQFGGPENFIAHVGGDDFVSGRKAVDDFARLKREIRRTLDLFREEVAAFYDESARERGAIVVADRYGVERAFPLLTVSAAVVRIRPESRLRGDDHLSPLIAGLKKLAKSDPEHIAIGVLS
ncbi:EAL domain/GGDEF [uncultured Alphaproteobacteria bacterium]|uniref:EAL domain/GGDEF n=1 Tax=uncultured Alphaproteobacteria bacterium TaxID=91750 RepID=A0A212KLM2_9PROT|nr:EAL domain/GGDEF [uncultured Alphaproteobacteria bacterium]